MSSIKVLVVDDSIVVRRIVSDALAEDPRIEVVGVAQNGSIALHKAAALKPDLITMDIEMPVMDGIDAVNQLRTRGDRMPIIMFSTLTSHGASATLDALAAGATDYVTKPSHVADPAEAIGVIKEQLLPKIKGLFRAPNARSEAARLLPTRGPIQTPKAVVVGSSTGGPEALSKMIAAFAHPLPVPMLIVQHMPPLFTSQLAARLDRTGPNKVVEAKGGEVLNPGTIYIAPGDFHMEVNDRAGRPQAVLNQGPQVNFCRPAVDVLFRSAAAVYGGNLLAVVLTGMGSDGREGARAIVEAGGRVIAQDEATSVVWGMPGAVATAGLAHVLVPISEVGPTITRTITPQSSRRAVTA